MDPSSRVVKKLPADCVERKTFSPSAWLWASVDTFDETGENPCMRVRRTRSQQNRVWVPRESSDGAPNGLLQVL